MESRADEGVRPSISPANLKTPLLKRINRSDIHSAEHFVRTCSTVIPHTRIVVNRSTMNSDTRLAITLFLTQVLAPFLLISSLFAQSQAPMKQAAEANLSLSTGWSLQTSAKVEAKGEVISTAQFAPKGWHEATVPT